MPPVLRSPLVLVLAVLLVVAAVVVGVRLVRGDEQGRPVLLVYGYQGTTEQMEPLAAALRAAGRNVTVVDLPDDNTGDLWDSAWTLGQVAREAMEDADADSVDVVAHSAGGIVTRLWISTAEADVAHRVVTLGSPHHGSNGADVFDECLEACQQLTPGSDFLDELAQQDETPGQARWVSIWSANDGAIEPPEFSELDGALNLRLQDICPGVEINHSQLLSDVLPINLAVAEVDADESGEYGSGDCGQFSGG